MISASHSDDARALSRTRSPNVAMLQPNTHVRAYVILANYALEFQLSLECCCTVARLMTARNYTRNEKGKGPKEATLDKHHENWAKRSEQDVLT